MERLVLVGQLVERFVLVGKLVERFELERQRLVRRPVARGELGLIVNAKGRR